MLAMVGEGISNPIALASGSPAPSLFTRDPSKDFDTLAAAGNSAPAGIWSDGTTMWAANLLDNTDSSNSKIYAYDMSTKTRVPSRDFDTLLDAGNIGPIGIWSDGTTMWVSMWVTDSSDTIIDAKIYAYDMSTKDRVPTRDFDNLSDVENSIPTGIWSDGTTMWVANLLDTDNTDSSNSKGYSEQVSDDVA